MINVKLLSEPNLKFGSSQEMAYPRTGLSLFGPFSKPNLSTLRIGYVGPPEGLQPTQEFLNRLMEPLRFWIDPKFRVPFPGFESVFECALPAQFALKKLISTNVLREILSIPERHQRIFKTVDLYLEPLLKARKEDDQVIDLWIVYVPEAISSHCRPKSFALADSSVSAAPHLTSAQLKKRLQFEEEKQLNLFEEDETDLFDPDIVKYKEDFRDQLKRRLLDAQVPVQLVRQSTIAIVNGIDQIKTFSPDLPKRQSAMLTHVNDILWNLSTTLFYKCCGTPWKLAELRPGVCYIGLVFKRTGNYLGSKALGNDDKSRTACCAAQMFLDSGDGTVFRGSVGPWYSPETKECHLDETAARDLIIKALEGYKEKFDGETPSELFIHGKTYFTDEEWKGFQSAVLEGTELSGIRIRTRSQLRFYPQSKVVALRGLAAVFDERRGLLLSNGWIPRMQTYPGREIPIPLSIDIVRGKSQIDTVLEDVFKLTKLNYNSCIYGDGIPVTLRFAESIGSILTAGPDVDTPPLPFKFYI